MVVDYAIETHKLSATNLSTITENVRNGDISVIMKDYEDSIKTPLKSIVAGEMLRILFIQIQKAKACRSI